MRRQVVKNGYKNLEIVLKSGVPNALFHPSGGGAMQAAGEKIFSFEGFTLDLRRGCLRRGEREVELRPKSFGLLRYLVENAGRLVPKDELIKAVWPDVIVSDESLAQCVRDVRVALGDDEQRIIKTAPRRGYVLAAPVSESAALGAAAQDAAATPAATAPSLPRVSSDTPSIAVLPFKNLSGDPDQEYFADGMAEEIVTALSRCHWLFVIARSSSFTYKGKAVDVKRVGRELGVRYVLEGSVRKDGDRVRITGQLADAASGAQLWADHFDGLLADVFDLQDQVTSSVAAAIEPRLRQAEIERSDRKPTDSLDAYDYFLRGVANFHRYSREGTRIAFAHFSKAIELDPGYASAYGMAAWCCHRNRVFGWSADPEHEIVEAERLARRAVQTGRDDPVALYCAGWTIAAAKRDLETGAALIDRALAINPNSPFARTMSGWLQAWLGNPEKAIEQLSRAMRLNPLDPTILVTQTAMAYAEFAGGRYAEAASWAEKALAAQPDFVQAVRVGASAYGLLNQSDDARRLMVQLRAIQPELTVSILKKQIPFRRATDFTAFMDGLSKAGLPED